MRAARKSLIALVAVLSLTAGCDSMTNADLQDAALNPSASDVETEQTSTTVTASPMAFEGVSQFWWEADFVSLPACNDGVMSQDVDVRVKLGKLSGTSPVPHTLVVTSLNVNTWDLSLVTTVDISEQVLRENDGQLRISFEADMTALGLTCDSSANLMMVQAVGGAGYGRTLDGVGLTSLKTFACEPTLLTNQSPMLECNTSCGLKDRTSGALCSEALVPDTIEVYFYDLQQGQLLEGLNTELEWTDEPSLVSVTATNSWRGAAALTSAHQIKVIIARDADGEILSVLGV